MPANIAVNSSGWMVTSKSCSKLRRIFIVARQARVMVWLNGRAEPDVGGQARGRVAQGGGEGGHRTASSSDVVVGGLVGLSSRLAGVVAGQGHEHLVERRLLDGHRLDRDALLAQGDEDVDGLVAALAAGR